MKLERFESSFKTFKTELLFATSQRASFEKLLAFVGTIDDPYIAKRVRDDFDEIAEKIMSATGDGRLHSAAPGIHVPLRHELGAVYGRLQTAYESDAIREARDVLEEAKALEASPHIHSPYSVEEAFEREFGREYARFLNDTDAYFDSHEDERPEEYKPIDERPTADNQERLEYAASLRKMNEAYDHLVQLRLDEAAAAQARLDSLRDSGAGA